MNVQLNVNTKALLELYSKSSNRVEVLKQVETYKPQKEQPVLYEGKDGKVLVKGVSNSGESKPIKR